MMTRSLCIAAALLMALYAQAQAPSEEAADTDDGASIRPLPKEWYGTWRGRIRQLNDDGSEFESPFVLIETIEISEDATDISVAHLQSKLTLKQADEEIGFDSVIQALHDDADAESQGEAPDTEPGDRDPGTTEEQDGQSDEKSFRIRRFIDDGGSVRVEQWPYQGQRRDLVALLPDGRLCIWPQSDDSPQHLITYTLEGDHLYWETITIPRDDDVGRVSVIYASLQRTD